jgi:NitT/TauT family transport system substrate-binding protein
LRANYLILLLLLLGALSVSPLHATDPADTSTPFAPNTKFAPGASAPATASPAATNPPTTTTTTVAAPPVNIEAIASQTAAPQTATPSAVISLPAGKIVAVRIEVKVAQSGDLFWYLPLYVAIDQGLFEKEGLDVSIINAGDDTKTVEAVMNGHAQFGIADPTIAATVRSLGQKERVVACMVNGAAFYGIAVNPKVTAIGRPSDLKKYSVATSPEATAGYALQKQMFEQGKVKPNIHPAPVGNLWTDLEAGRSDIALESEPNVSLALKMGGRIVYSMPDLYSDFAMAGAVVSEDTLQKHPELVQKFVSAIAEAQREIYADPGIAVDAATKRFPALSKDIAATAVQNMLKNKTVPASPVISAESWKNACKLRSRTAGFGSMDHIMDIVENKFALKAVVQTTP